VLLDGAEEDAMDEASPDPERSARQGEARVLLERAIDRLPEHFRAVFVLRAVEELSVAETAAVLDLAEETVKTRLFRARRLLREGIGAELEGAGPDVFAFAGDRCERITAAVLRRLE
jgi:RNA polymerase sigma-70 factor (ECF subfamily)